MNILHNSVALLNANLLSETQKACRVGDDLFNFLSILYIMQLTCRWLQLTCIDLFWVSLNLTRFFWSIFASFDLQSTPCKHPVIVLQDVAFTDLHALVEFIYHGEVNVHQRSLSSFLKTAEVLRVSGLTQQQAEETHNVN